MSNNEINQKHLKYMKDINAALLLTSPRKSRQVLYLVLLVITISIIWAGFAEIDEVTVGTGKVIPSQQVQVIQNLEGGILKEIAVSEGQLVETGQKLLSIDSTQFLSEYREQATQGDSLKARIHRLETQIKQVKVMPQEQLKELIEGDDSLPFQSFPSNLDPGVVNQQRGLYQEEIQGLIDRTSILEQQINQKQAEMDELNSKVKFLERSYELVKKEIEITVPLARNGVVSEVEVIKLERAGNEVKGELEGAKLLIPKLKSEIEEAKRKRNEQFSKFRTEAQKELAEAQDKLNSLDEVLVSLQDRLERTTVTSPVNGTIKTIKINTVGGVIQPGMDLIEIVPVEDSLLVEAKIDPKDIAFLRPGLDAIIKLSAYDFAIYGGLKGKVEHISADTIKDEKDESYYYIKVRTEESYLDSNNKPLPIIPGMTANVDVITGKKTVLDYLLKPIVRAKHNAMREK
ncbi:HlyD family type I secretion periplasmic adaptor subunit [Psychrosphaera ytuae]|uniref:Membrane fusion protein (MFP) family protein n=1 Tax=Psychrosphaera ytuae TaxID=2820710 RepID=A0A975DCP0_9GAMM|nr:HlyD family type I secretion periplasmic adaptor subunit [Psychrosphaera ytuae]QTH64671.1 HlyD family type I secretion periplasmic adaptor subunit [Psychrosphaera ytuae]